MQKAVGLIQTLGFPSILAAADAMVKGAKVTLVYFDKAERGQFAVAIRGPVSEVKTAMEKGLEAAENTFGGEIMSHYIVPNPPDNVVAVLPFDYTDKDIPYRF